MADDLDDVIAIVGLGLRVPGAADLEDFWRNLCAGRESVVAADEDELRRRGVSRVTLAGSAYVPAVACLDDADMFDAAFFGMTPREAQLCDPQIRLFLEIAHTAIEQAGYDPAAMPGSVGVFASAGPARYAELCLSQRRDLLQGSAGALVESLNHPDYLATTVSYRLNLRGPSMTILTACSSSLVALHIACQALRLGDCDMAVVGGADLRLPYRHGYLWSPGGVRSRTGHCRPFDADADGTVFGSGAAAVVLKRLPDAERDHDRITALVLGSAVNNDGADKVSFSAPSVAGQVAVIVEAMTVAGVGPADISFVEAHGTGTPLGDPIEIAALAQAYQRLDGASLGGCPVGSVKGNVGHLGAVAGVTGLVKAALALDRAQLPPSGNFTRPNPKLELDSTPFQVADRLLPLRRETGRPRRAGVSSLGVGGSNAHVILGEAAGLPSRPASHDELRPRLVVWSGRDHDTEQAARRQLHGYFSRCGDDVYADAVATLQHGRARHQVRAAAVAPDARGAAAALSAGQKAIARGEYSGPPRPVALLMPGQGVQRARMAAGLYDLVPAFTEVMDECLALLADLGLDARGAWLGDGAGLDDTQLAQPLLVAVEIALAHAWATIGSSPQAVLGHSVGELAAACAAGVFSRSDAMRLMVARSTAMAQAPSGGMLAVAAGEQDVADVLDAEVRLAVVNGPRQVVLSGPADALAAAASALAARGKATRTVRTSGAFHHPMLAQAAASFETAFASVELSAPKVRLYSPATGTEVTDEQARDPAFWARQLTMPVRFDRAAQALLGAGPALLIEAGPGRDLIGMLRSADAVRSGTTTLLASLPREAGDASADATAFLAALGQLWAEGHRVDFTAAGQPAPSRREPLPAYPYQRQRHWADAVDAGSAPDAKEHRSSAEEPEERAAADPDRAASQAAQPAPVAPPAATTAFSVVNWEEIPAAAAPQRSGQLALMLLPQATSRALDLVLAVQQAGYRTVRVRPAASYAVVGEEFQVRPGATQDMDLVLAALARRGQHPDLLVHALAADRWPDLTLDNLPDQLDLAFHSLLALAQRALRPGPDGRQPALVALTRGAVDVSGDDDAEPVKAAIAAAVRTLALEQPWLAARVIDLSDRTSPAALRDELRRTGPDLVALRGRRRWASSERPLVLPTPSRPSLRTSGVYVVTGGLGGLGLVVAKGLASTGLEPRIALLGRRGLAEGAELERLLAAGDERTSRVADALAAIEAMGGQAKVIECDITDLRQTRRALDLTTGLFGPVNGILHLAGVPGDGMLQRRGREAADAVLAPKVQGAAVLAHALAGKPPLDFLIHFSSRAARDGLVGSGDYAAANAVLDLTATRGSGLAERVLSIGWPSWSQVGMAASALADPVVKAGQPAGAGSAGIRPVAASTGGISRDEPPAGVLRWETVLSHSSAWALDEHRLDGIGLLPGSGHLDLVLRACQELLPDEPPPWAGGTTPLELCDVVFTAPLAVPQPRLVRVELTSAGERRQFTVQSRPEAEPGADWTRHLTGRLERAARPAARLDLAEMRAGLAPAQAPDVAGEGRMFTLGPRWHSITSVSARDKVKVIDLSLPAEYCRDLDVHPVHPALLDCATSAVRDATEPFHLPFMYRRMTVYGRLPAVVTAVNQRRRAGGGLIVADVSLTDPAGAVLVAVTGFTMRQVDPAGFSLALATPPAAGPPAARRARAEASDDRRRPGKPGIPPDQGVALLLTLLATDTPERVLVRPYADDQPVPLADAPATSAAQPSEPAPGETTPQNFPPAAPALAPMAPAAAAPEPEPRAPARDGVAAAWRQVLGVTDISPDDDFFDLGGNSLSAVELMSMIRDSFGIELNIAMIFDAPTLAGLTRLIDEQVAPSDEPVAS